MSQQQHGRQLPSKAHSRAESFTDHQSATGAEASSPRIRAPVAERGPSRAVTAAPGASQLLLA